MISILPTSVPSALHNCSLSSNHLSCKAGNDGGLSQTFHLLVKDKSGTIMANLSSSTPTWSLAGLGPGLSLAASSYNQEGVTLGPVLSSGPVLDSSSPAQALPSLRTQGLKVTPVLGALIGVGAALGLLTMVLLIVLLCRGKRSVLASNPSLQVESKLPPLCPDLISSPSSHVNENIYIVDSIPSCPPSHPYSTLQHRPRPPPSIYSCSSLCPRRMEYGAVRLPMMEETTLLLPPLPPPSSSSSGSELDSSRSSGRGESEV